MAEISKLIVPNKGMKYDGRARNAIRARPPLAELNIELIDKNGRSMMISGFVRNGVNGLKGVPAAIKQNGGVFVVEGEYLKMISFPSRGIEIEYPQFYRNGGLPFKIENGEVVWSSLSDTIIKGKTHLRIQDDRQYTKDMPDIKPKVSAFFEEKKCEGCGGENAEKEILTSPALALALADPDTEFSYNPITGSIIDLNARQDFSRAQNEFLSAAGIPPDLGGFVLGRRPVTGIRQENGCEHTLNIYYENPSDRESDQRESWKRKKLALEDSVNEVFMDYSIAFLTGLAGSKTEYNYTTGRENPIKSVTTDFKFTSRHFAQDSLVLNHGYSIGDRSFQEENPIIRLLMNPVERKLWGKLYGLPDEDEARTEFAASPIKVEKQEAKALEYKRDDDEKPFGIKISPERSKTAKGKGQAARTDAPGKSRVGFQPRQPFRAQSSKPEKKEAQRKIEKIGHQKIFPRRKEEERKMKAPRPFKAQEQKPKTEKRKEMKIKLMDKQKKAKVKKPGQKISKDLLSGKEKTAKRKQRAKHKTKTIRIQDSKRKTKNRSKASKQTKFKTKPKRNNRKKTVNKKRNPEAKAHDPKRKIRDFRPETRKLATGNRKPRTPDTKRSSRPAKHKTRNTKRKTRNRKPITRKQATAHWKQETLMQQTARAGSSRGRQQA